MRYARWPVLVAWLVFAAPTHADDWPIPRGPSSEPLPYRFDPKIVKSIPKDILDDATACVLYSATTNLIEPDGTVSAISHEITRLNSRKGIEKLGEYRSITYDPTFEKLTLNTARIIKANGSIVPIEPRHVQLRDVATDFQVYDQDKQLVISFPNLEVGDIYEVKWTVRGKNREFGGDFFYRYTFGDDQTPVLRDEFRVYVPRNKTLQYATINGKVDLVITDDGAGKLYHWTAQDRRELPRDEERPSKEELRLQVAVSTFPSWEAVGQWKHDLRKECWECKPQVRKIIAEVTRGKETPIEKAKALTYWVRRHVRYLSRGPSGLGYTPHLPHHVMDHLYGDCKDQAQLLAVMLKEIGLPVWLVTLGTLDDGQVLKDVPSPWGSHAILLTQIDGKDYWIDTTVSLAAWDFLPRSDRDRQIYATKGTELKLLKTPPFTADDYRIEQITHVTIQADGATRSKREATYFNSAAWSKRDKWLEVPPGERRRAMTAELQDANAKSRLVSLKIDEKRLLDFDAPVRAEVEFEIPKHFTGESTREGVFSDSPVWTWFLGYNLDVERTLPYLLPTPFESNHRYVITLPTLFRLDSVPESRHVKSPWGEFRLGVKHDAGEPRRIELDMSMRLDKTRVEKSEFAAFLQFQDDVTKAYRVWLTLRPTLDIADAPALEKQLAEAEYKDAATAKVLAKMYLDHDRADAARKLLDKITPRFPKDAALWELRVSAAANNEDEERLYVAMVQQFPEEPKYAAALGASYVRREDHAAALKILSPLTGNALGSVRGAAHYQLARSAYRQNDAAKALKHLQAALLTDSASLATIDALHFKARVHERLGQTGDAIKALQAALEADTNARDILEYLVRLEMKAERHDAALDHLRRYTIAASKDAASLLRAADLHLQLGRHEEAFDLASKIRDQAFQTKAERILGLVLFAKRDYAQAALHLERGDLDAQALAALIQAHLRLGDLDSAARRAQAIRKMKQADKELLALEKLVAALGARRDQMLGQWKLPKEREAIVRRIVNRYLCAERGLEERWQREQIEKLVHDADAENLDFAPILALRGLLALEKGQLRKALADSNAALKLRPTDARAFLVRGRVRLEQGDLESALVDLRKATEFSKSSDPIVLHWLAAALLEAGRTKDAVETQRLAVLLRPNDAELREQLRRMEVLQENRAPVTSDGEKGGIDRKLDVIQWRTDYAVARKASQENRLPILILFTAPYSTVCERMDQEATHHAALANCLNTRFVPLKLVAGQKNFASVAQGLEVVAYPTAVVADSDGTIRKTIVGYVEPEKLLAELRAMAPPK